MGLRDLSDADLLALKAGDLSKVSDAGLLALRQDAAPASGPTQASAPNAPSNFDVAKNAGNETVAAIPDMFLNAPTNVMNLGKAAYGTAATAFGRPDLAPTLTEPPNYARKALEAGGFIRPEWQPATTGQKYLGAAASGAVGGAPGGIPGMAVGALSNLAGQGVSDLTGSPALGTVAGLASYPAMNAAQQYGTRQMALADALKQQKAPITDTLNEVRGAGYAVPPGQVQDISLPKRLANGLLERLGGKAATQQQASINNQTITDEQVRKGIRAPATMGITDEALSNLSDQRAQPYRDVASLPPTPANPAYLGTVPANPSPAALLDDLRATRLDAKLQWNEFNKAGSVTAYKAYEQAIAKAAQLESQIEQAAVAAGRADLVPALRESRTNIAKIHDVQRALNTDRGETSALDLAKAKDKGVPLTGELLTAAKMGNAYPKAVQRPENVGSPGLNNLSQALAASAGGGIGAALGGPVGAGAGAAIGGIGYPMAQELARKLMLSKGYQKHMVTPNYDAGMAARLAAGLQQTPPDAAVMRAYLLSQQLQGQ